MRNVTAEIDFITGNDTTSTEERMTTVLNNLHDEIYHLQQCKEKLEKQLNERKGILWMYRIVCIVIIVTGIIGAFIV